MKDQEKVNKQILAAEKELAALDAKRAALQDRIINLKSSKQTIDDEQLPFDRLSVQKVTNESFQGQKIARFRTLFRGREDVFPRRFESKHTGKSGFKSICRNEME